MTPPMGTPADVLRFGPFRLDPAKRVLWRGDEVVPLAPRALDLLVALAEQQGDVVPKQTLMDRVWPGTFVEEANLSVNVSALRKALGAQADGRPYIETLARRGYRLAAPVRAATAARPPSIAVLPFKRLSSVAEDEYLAVGLADREPACIDIRYGSLCSKRVEISYPRKDSSFLRCRALLVYYPR